jgi:hypothetical protein
MEAVFDMVILSGSAKLFQLSEMDLRIPDARCNQIVCIAAIYIVHCNMDR